MSGDAYDDAAREWLEEWHLGTGPGRLASLAAMGHTQIAQALKPVEEERDRLKAWVNCAEHSCSPGFMKPNCLFCYIARLREQLEEAQAEATRMHKWQGLAGQRADLAEQQLADARELLQDAQDRLEVGRQSESVERLIARLRAFLAQSPAAPPKECDGTEAGLGCDCGQVHEPPEPHSFEPGPSSWGTGCLICKMPKEDHAPASAHSAKP